MSTDLERYEPQHVVGGNPKHLRLTIDQVAKVANNFAESGLWKKRVKVNGSWVDQPYTAYECWAIIMAGQALGVAPFPSMTSFHMIEGRPEMSANLQAHFLKSSPKYDYRMNFEYDDNDSVKACVVVVYDKQSGESVGESRFTRQMAQKAGLIRQGGNWDKYAESMLFARAISNAVAWHAPDAVPMRIYSEGEISGQGEASVSAVAGESSEVTPERGAAMVDAALEAEVIEDVEIVEPEPNVGVDPDAESERAEPERFSPEAIEQRLRADLPKLDTEDREIIKSLISEAGLEFKYSSIVKLLVASGFTDIRAFLAFKAQSVSGGTAAPDPLPSEEEPPVGVTGRATGSQTQPTVSDAQVRLFNAKCSEAGLSEPERRLFLRKYASVDSSRAIAKKDMDDLLAVLADIAQGDEATRRAYLPPEEM